MQPVDVPSGETRRVSVGFNNFPFTQMFVAFDKYWLQFDNLPARLPDVAAAYSGAMPPRTDLPIPRWANGAQLTCAINNPGLVVLRPKGLNVTESVDIRMFLQVFRVRRIRYTNYKEYQLTIPSTLPPLSGDASGFEDGSPQA